MKLPVGRCFNILVLLLGLGLASASQAAQKSSEQEFITGALQKPEPREYPWRFQVFGGLPEIYGVQLEYRLIEWASLYSHYAWPSLLRVNAEVKSKTLVKRDGVAIRSPSITLPFDFDLGPHAAIGFNFFPFRFPLFFGLGLERRIISIKTEAKSRFLFVDGEGQTFSNTLIDVYVDSRTQQSLLRLTMGYDWPIFDRRWIVSLFGGLTKVLLARTTVASDIDVVNSQASDPNTARFAGLAEAELKQEANLNDSGKETLGPYQYRSLPLLGLSLALTF